MDEYVWLCHISKEARLISRWFWQLIQLILNYWPRVFNILDRTDGKQEMTETTCGLCVPRLSKTNGRVVDAQPAVVAGPCDPQ